MGSPMLELFKKAEREMRETVARLQEEIADRQLEASSVVEQCKKAEGEMRKNAARLQKEIADSLEQSLQQATMIASTAAATEAPTEGIAPSRQINLDKNDEQGMPTRIHPTPEAARVAHRSLSLPRRASGNLTDGQSHPLDLALHRLDGRFERALSPASDLWPRFTSEV